MAQSADHDDHCLQEYEYRYQPELLQGKVAFITGGGSGIGFRIAELFMRHGCDVAIGSRRMNKLEEVCLNKRSLVWFVTLVSQTVNVSRLAFHKLMHCTVWPALPTH